ncbi:MAG: hypothetical protein PVJ32_05665 [Anaerolineales bacterium]|jgi:hypothetical protein
MSRAVFSTLVSRIGNLSAALMAGLEAGLAGLTLTFAMPLVLWILELENLVCLIPVLGNFVLWPCTGMLAALWLNDRGSTARGDYLIAGLLAGAITGVASGGASGLVSLLRLINSQTLGGLRFLGKLTSGQLIIGTFITFGLPVAAIAILITALTSLVTGGMLSAPMETTPVDGSRLQSALGRRSPREAYSRLPLEIIPSRRDVTEDLIPAVAALEEGDRKLAASLLANLLRKRPRHVQAWLWMAAALDELDRKRDCVRRALSFDPHNQHALRMLEAFEGSESPKAKSAEASPQRRNPLRAFLLRYVPRRTNVRYLIPVAGVEIIMVCLALYVELT